MRRNQKQATLAAGTIAFAAIAGAALWMTGGDSGTTAPAETDSGNGPVVAESQVQFEPLPIPTEQWIPIKIEAPRPMPSAALMDVASYLWFSEPIDDQSELVYGVGCSVAGYSISWRESGFVIDDVGPSSRSIPPPPVRLSLCVSDSPRVDLFSMFDSITAEPDSELTRFGVRSSDDGQFSFELDRLYGAVSVPNPTIVPELNCEGEASAGYLTSEGVAFATAEEALIRSLFPSSTVYRMIDVVQEQDGSFVGIFVDPQDRVSRLVTAEQSTNGLWQPTRVTGCAPLGLELRNAATWHPADTRIGGDSSPTVHRIDGGVLILNTENRGNNIIGEIWDDETRAARKIGDTGLVWRHRPAAAWTGDELLLVGGSNGPGIDRVGVAYDPDQDSWRDLADPPSSTGGAGFWTGSAMVIPAASLRYDPAQDAWTTIAQWPFPDRQTAFVEPVEGGLVAWGGCEGPLCDETNTGVFESGALYGFASDNWTDIPDGPLPPTAHAVAEWTGTELVVVVTASDEGVAAAAFNPSTNSWRSLPKPPLPARRASAMTLSQDRLVLWGGTMNDGAIFRLPEQDWKELPRAPLSGAFHTLVDLGSSIYVSGSYERSPQILELPDSRDLEYQACATDAGFDPQGVQVVFTDGRAQFVKTGRNVPAEVHLPCLEQIGGPSGDIVSGSSHGQVVKMRRDDN